MFWYVGFAVSATLCGMLFPYKLTARGERVGLGLAGLAFGFFFASALEMTA